MFRAVHFAVAPFCIKSSGPEPILGGVLDHLCMRVVRSNFLLNHDSACSNMHA